MSSPPRISPYLYGLHDPGGEHTMLDRSVPGWVLVTVAIGANPADQGPGDDTRFLADYRQLTGRGLGVIVRLNHGYGSSGTLPYERSYDDFARRCANFVRISKGARLWIIGNEPNHPIEWPGSDWNWNAVPPRPNRPDSEGEKITPERYARCFIKVRQAICSLPGHDQDQVLVAGVAPWNNLTTYTGNANGDWVQYFADLLRIVGPANADGIALHAYTHGTNPALVTSDAKVGDARYSRYHWHFRTYRDFMQAIPDNMRHLPVYITETDQGDDPWLDQNSGWVREAYKEIDAWNQQQAQRIRALLLYRWPRVGEDRWWIEGKQGVVEDFQQAIDRRYAVPEGPPGLNLQQLKQEVDALAAKVAALEPQLKKLADLSAQATALESTVNGLTQQAQQAATARSQLDDLTREVESLEQAVRLLAGNYIKAAHYLDWYPRTLETYRYLGFHEYGWPTLRENPGRGTSTSALFYRPCMAGIRACYGDRHRAIVTEAGLARMYKYPSDPAGDVGWLYAGDTITEDDYWESLSWYSGELAQDSYVLGACLFQVGHAGRWETFRHLGTDSRQRPILLMNKIATLNEAPAVPPSVPPPALPQEDLATLQRRIASMITALEAGARLSADFQAQVVRLQRTMDGLVPAATAAASLPLELARLLERLDLLDAALDRLEATGQASAGAVAALQRQTAAVRAQIVALEPAARQAATVAPNVAKAQKDLVPLVKGAEEAKALSRQIDLLLVEARRLAAVAGPPPPKAPAEPATVDVRRELPESDRQPAALGYPSRSLEAIGRIVVHHTMTRADITPERLAEMHTERGLAGIRYHYLVTGDGTLFWTQPLETVLPATGSAEVNLDSVAIALAGNFSADVPSTFQLDAAAAIIAWLLEERNLAVEDVFGRGELEPPVVSPGIQWLQGARFKDSLLDRVEAILAGA